MKQTVNLSQFRAEFKAYSPTQFSYEGLQLLFNHFEELNPDMEMDVVAICVEFSEDTLEDCIGNFDIDVAGLYDPLEAVLEHMDDKTTVVGVTEAGGIVYADF